MIELESMKKEKLNLIQRIGLKILRIKAPKDVYIAVYNKHLMVVQYNAYALAEIQSITNEHVHLGEYSLYVRTL
jgi:hypothetical protein